MVDQPSVCGSVVDYGTLNNDITPEADQEVAGSELHEGTNLTRGCNGF